MDMELWESNNFKGIHLKTGFTSCYNNLKKITTSEESISNLILKFLLQSTGLFSEWQENCTSKFIKINPSSPVYEFDSLWPITKM